jgi:hypothetical protein
VLLVSVGGAAYFWADRATRAFLAAAEAAGPLAPQ